MFFDNFNFDINDFSFYLFYDDDKLILYNNSKYDCRFHISDEINKKGSFFCQNMKEIIINKKYKNLKIYYDEIPKNEKTKIEFYKLQIYINDKTKFSSFKEWKNKYLFEKGIDIRKYWNSDKKIEQSKNQKQNQDNNNHSDKTSLSKKIGEISWSDNEDIEEEHKKLKENIEYGPILQSYKPIKISYNSNSTNLNNDQNNNELNNSSSLNIEKEKTNLLINKMLQENIENDPQFIYYIMELQKICLSKKCVFKYDIKFPNNML